MHDQPPPPTPKNLCYKFFKFFNIIITPSSWVPVSFVDVRLKSRKTGENLEIKKHIWL